jgi:EF hand
MKIRTSMRLLSFAMLLLAPAIVLAQPPGLPSGGQPPDGSPPRAGRSPDRPAMANNRLEGMGTLVEALDKNHDGVLSDEEIRKASDALRALDRDNNGRIERSELQGRPANRAGRAAVVRRSAGGPGGFGRGGAGGFGPDGFGPGGPGGPGGFGAGGPGGMGGGAGGMGGGYPVGTVIPPAICQRLRLNPQQRQALHVLEANVRTGLGTILTPQQMRECQEAFVRGGPGGPMGGPPRGPGGPGNDDGPPVRPGRPDSD